MDETTGDYLKMNIKRMAVLIFALSALLAVTQASSLRKQFLGATENVTETKTNSSAPTVSVMSAAAQQVNTTEDQSATSSAPNIIDLIGDSELILRGAVKDVTDGLENGVPYTEVTLQVNEALRGQVGEEYTFRQFGLTKPRKMENGRINLNVTPEGWSKYGQGEDVVLFLYKQASITGLRTTVGLGQGKFDISAGNITSQVDNDGLFSNVEVDSKLTNDRDKRLLATKKGPVNKESFLSFVRRAVNEKWVEGGKMRHVKK